MSYLKSIIVYIKNNRPFKIEIDPNKSILELKKIIASRFNSTYTGFNLFNGINIIDNSKNNCSIEECGLLRLIRIFDDSFFHYFNKSQDLLDIIVIRSNLKPYRIEISSDESILTLKQLIADHFNLTYTDFNILSGKDIIDNLRNNCSIKSCGLKKVIRIPDNYEPGF